MTRTWRWSAIVTCATLAASLTTGGCARYRVAQPWVHPAIIADTISAVSREGTPVLVLDGVPLSSATKIDLDTIPIATMHVVRGEHAGGRGPMVVMATQEAHRAASSVIRRAGPRGGLRLRALDVRTGMPVIASFLAIRSSNRTPIDTLYLVTEEDIRRGRLTSFEIRFDGPHLHPNERAH